MPPSSVAIVSVPSSKNKNHIEPTCTYTQSLIDSVCSSLMIWLQFRPDGARVFHCRAWLTSPPDWLWLRGSWFYWLSRNTLWRGKGVPVEGPPPCSNVEWADGVMGTNTNWDTPRSVSMCIIFDIDFLSFGALAQGYRFRSICWFVFFLVMACCFFPLCYNANYAMNFWCWWHKSWGVSCR